MNSGVPGQVPLYVNATHEIFSGPYHCFAIDIEGFWAWGKSQKCKLGFETIKEVQPVPKGVKMNIKQIAAGSNHTFAWNNKKIYCWGDNFNYQLGLEEERSYQICQMPLLQDASEAGIKLKRITCGENHSLAVFEKQDESQTTQLYAWGQSKSSQLTLDTLLNVPQPVLSQYNIQISTAYSKSDYNIAICQNDVYAWGSNIFGRLGVSTMNKKIQRIPSKIITLQEPISKIGLGVYHVIAINSNGQVYSWGHGLHGQLGIGKIVSEAQPSKVKGIKDVVDASCGQKHSIILMKNGALMSCGSNNQLALGHNSVDHKKRCLQFQNVQGNFQSQIFKISCGYEHNMVLTKNGKIYTWGSNKYGQLGRKIIQQPLSKQQQSKKIKNAQISEDRMNLPFSRKSHSISKENNKNNEQLKSEQIKIWKVKYEEFRARVDKQEKAFMDELEKILNNSKID